MKLPEKYNKYEIFANENLEDTLRARLSELKNGQCEFILCLENCRNQKVHQFFKQIAYNELGKLFFNEFIYDFFFFIQVLLLNVLILQKFSEYQT